MGKTPKFFFEIKKYILRIYQNRQYILAAIVVVFLISLWILPKYQVPPSLKLSTKEQIEQENAARSVLVQLFLGLVQAGIVWATLGAIRQTQQALELSKETAESAANATKELRITESFSRAIEQLGSDKLAVRLGGIYALERISKESDKDYWQIIEILTLFVRVNSPRSILIGELPPPVDVDTQAILTILARRKKSFGEGEDYSINLSYTDLLDGDLSYAEIPYINFEGANLYNANLEGANLLNAHLVGAILRKTNLKDAILNKTNLLLAKLEGSKLSGVNFTDAYFVSAQ